MEQKPIDTQIRIFKNQLGRRNLTDFQRVEMAHCCEDAIRARARERQEATQFGGGGNFTTTGEKARDELGVAGNTVTAQRKEMEESGELLQCNSSIGADGKERPRQVERRPAVEPPTPEPVRETPVMMEPETPTPFVRRGMEVYPGTGYTPNQRTPSAPLASDGVSVRHGTEVYPGAWSVYTAFYVACGLRNSDNTMTTP